MGHERIGFLPKTKQWQVIIHELEKYSGDPEANRGIASTTRRIRKISYFAEDTITDHNEDKGLLDFRILLKILMVLKELKKQ